MDKKVTDSDFYKIFSWISVIIIGLSIFIAILSNTIEQITDYALNVGINKETIVSKIDRSKRYEKIFENKIKEFYQMNKRDNKSVEELKQFAEELGLGGNQIKLALSKARWW